MKTRPPTKRALLVTAVLTAAIMSQVGFSEAALGMAGVSTTALSGNGQLQALPTSTIKLRSDETWATNLNRMTATGLTKVDLAAVMADTRHAKAGVPRADTSTSGITNYVAGRSWSENSTDQTSAYYYYPQGLTMTDTNTRGTGSHDVILGEKGVVNNVDHHSRIAVFDTRAGTYHTVLLVRPTASGGFGQFASHVGGVVQIGNYLYAGDFPAAGAASQKIAVFDLTEIYVVNAGSSCATSVGAVSSVSPPFCGYGERWVLPVMNTYYFQNTDGSTPLPMLDGLGMDNHNQSAPQLLTVEYCNGAPGLDGYVPVPCRRGCLLGPGLPLRVRHDGRHGPERVREVRKDLPGPRGQPVPLRRVARERQGLPGHCRLPRGREHLLPGLQQRSGGGAAVSARHVRQQRELGAGEPGLPPRPILRRGPVAPLRAGEAGKQELLGGLGGVRLLTAPAHETSG